MSRAIDALPGDLKEWATPLLEESTPPVARHRVKEIVDSLGAIGEELAGDDVELFARDVIATRNELTHPNERPMRNAFETSDEIYWFGLSLYWIGVAYLLKELGMEVSDITTRLRQRQLAGSTIEEVRALANARWATTLQVSAS